MAVDMASAADTLVRSADRAGENTARSAMDSSFSGFQLPTDPNKLGQMYGQVADDLMTDLDIPGALKRSNDLSQRSGVAAAASVFESRYAGEELAKTPVADLDQEIDRLSEQRWSILPSVMGRSDIIDYGAKMRMATRAQDILDTEIDRLTDSRDRLVKAAEGRAKNKVEGLKAEAALLDKQVTAAQNDMRTRIDLFKEGRATFDDVVQAALSLKKLNDDKAAAGSGANPFLGMGAGEGEFPPGLVLLFGQYEKLGEFPGVDSSKVQLKLQLGQLYGKWVAAGRPGSQIQTGGLPLPEGVQGPIEAPAFTDVADLYEAPAAAKKSNAASALQGLFDL